MKSIAAASASLGWPIGSRNRRPSAHAHRFRLGPSAWATYPNGPLFFSVLKHGNRLYVATSRGLYYREIPPFVPTAVRPTSINASRPDKSRLISLDDPRHKAKTEIQ